MVACRCCSLPACVCVCAQRLPLKSTSPLPSSSNMSMTLCTSGFCWSSGSDRNSSKLRAPELSRSSLRNRLPRRLISSASTNNNNNNNKGTRNISHRCRHKYGQVLTVGAQFHRQRVFVPLENITNSVKRPDVPEHTTMLHTMSDRGE